MQQSYSVQQGLGEETPGIPHGADLPMVDVYLQTLDTAPNREGQSQPEGFRALFEASGDAIFMVDEGGMVVHANDVAQSLSRYSLGELQSMRFLELFTHGTRPRAALFFSRNIAGSPRRMDLVALCKNHTQVHVALSAVPIISKGATTGLFCTFRDITEQNHLQAELRKNCTDAERAKDRFLSVLSHELRTPLMPVLTTVQMLELRAEVPPEIRDMLGMMRRNLELEARLIDDLLDLNRIRQGKLSLYIRNTDVNTKIRNVIELCQSDVHEKRLRLRLELDAAQHICALDPARVQQMLWNVIGNAIKFTPVGGTITIRTCNGQATAAGQCCADAARPCEKLRHCPGGQNEVLAVHVTDTGVGIEPASISRLFQAFEHSGSDGLCTGGAGVGLAISKAMMELHGGQLLAHSGGLGKGSTFTMLFPMRQVADTGLQRQAAVQLPKNTTSQRRVLLVEDHLDTARVLNYLLTTAGFQVTVANCVQQAVAAGLQHSFDLLISDIGLPDGTGADVVRQLHQRSRIPAIALSGYGMDEDIRRSHDAGFSDHMVKPINVQQLHATIERLLSSR